METFALLHRNPGDVPAAEQQPGPAVGFSRPAIRRISVVFPDSVVPSRMLNTPSSRTRSVGWMWVCAPTLFTTSLSSMAIVSSSDRGRGPAQSDPPALPGVRDFDPDAVLRADVEERSRRG